jgi:hypothetical protein
MPSLDYAHREVLKCIWLESQFYLVHKAKRIQLYPNSISWCQSPILQSIVTIFTGLLWSICCLTHGPFILNLLNWKFIYNIDLPIWYMNISEMGSTTHFITSSPIQIFLFHLLSIRKSNNFYNTCLKTNNVRVLYILLATTDKSTITSIGMN